MAKKFHVLASVLALSVSVTALTACGGNNNNGGSASPAGSPSSSASASAASSGAKDTITALLPPVSANYQANFDQMEKDFNALYPNLTLKIEPASWEDMTTKLDTQVNAGSPPDIAFIGSDGITKYADTGLLMNISDVATPEMIADYDPTPLQYMKNGDGLYGFPAYVSVQSIGGNKAMLEAAGIDWKNVQKNGWTFDEFREAIKKGTVKDGDKTRYGFVFAVNGVTAKDYLNILIKNAGMPSPFTTDLKFAYTSKNFLTVLQGIRELIDDGSMPKELSSIDAGKRWNMFLTGQTMITGKGLATFENSAKQNNAKLEAKDASAVADSIPVDYVVLPVPTFAGQPAVSQAAVDGYVTFRGKKEPTAEHKANVVKAAYFLDSGKVMAQTNNELFLGQITKSARDAAAGMTTDRDPDNLAAETLLESQAAPARPDITPELGAKFVKLQDEVIVPKFQALLAGELSPEDMYDAVKKAAIDAFGADGVAQD